MSDDALGRFTIRNARQSDLPAIFEILNAEILSGVNTFKLDPLGTADHLPWWNAHRDIRYPIWVADDADGRVVGWASLSPWSLTHGAYHATAEVSIWVAAQHQGRGMGKQLMQAMIDHATQAPLRVLLSKVEASNTASLALHQRVGFSQVGTLHGVGEKLGKRLDVVILELALAER